jgi:radical SAM superfamily enzyme YgiQ (UPF0313 family)
VTSLYMINPKPTVSCYTVGDGWVSSPDLALVTIAAMAPPHWSVSVTEELVGPVDLDSSARFVGLTGKTAQYARMVELSDAFRRRGKTVLIGGPFASLDPEAVRPHADILVTGELEDIAPQFFADLEAGAWKTHYDGGRADIRKSPVPRWDLYPTHKAMTGALQTTRGCPFDCEFCDVIQYQGRKQRHKDLTQIIAELDALYAAGFRDTFLSDDNFTVHRQFARQTLDAIAEWNAARTDGPMRFRTQASLDIARDDDLMRRCVAAGLTNLFIGIETTNEASLRETKKRQNLLLPIHESVERIVSTGIYVRAGVIVGFDHDGPSIFGDLFDFFQTSPLPDLTVGVLTASVGTPLHARVKREGRLLEGRWDEHLFNCNIVPKLMTTRALVEGTRELAAALYTAEAFERRLMRLIDAFPDLDAAPVRSPPGERTRGAMGELRRIRGRGKAETRMLSTVLAAALEKPWTFSAVVTSLSHFEQTRTYLDYVSLRMAEAA